VTSDHSVQKISPALFFFESAVGRVAAEIGESVGTDDNPINGKVNRLSSSKKNFLLLDLNIPIPTGVKRTGHSLRRGDASAAHAIGASITVIMAWELT